MDLSEIKKNIHPALYEILEQQQITQLRPSQEKAIRAGLLKGKNLLVCTPTASGKTLVAELAAIHTLLTKKGKALYIVPLKALASEKHKEFKKRYGHLLSVALSLGDLDGDDARLFSADLILTTSEKFDSLIRHRVSWIHEITTLVIDEAHLLTDPNRGPTIEIVITITKQLLPHAQILALSATIGNPKELAAWLDATLVIDNWRPVALHKGVYCNGTLEFYEQSSDLSSGHTAKSAAK